MLLIHTDACRSKYYDSSEDEFDDDGESEEDFDVGSDGESDDEDASPVAEMDEISSDEEDNEFGPDLYKDEDDRYRLAQMTDMDRQAILYERGEQRNAIRQRNQLKAQLRRQRGLPVSSKGQSAVAKKTRSAKASAAASSADAPRKVSGKKAALDALKERRKADGARSRRNEDDDEDDDYGDAPRSKPAPKVKEVKESVRAQKQRLESEAKAQRQRDRHRLDSDDEDDPAYHEVVYDNHGKRIILTSEIDKDYLAKMLVKRDELIKWMDAPHWAKTVKGSFVRLSLGRNDNGDPTYRIAEIVDFNPDGRSYELPPDASSSGRPRTATMTITVAIGGNTKEQTLERVSNKPFTPEEYDEWITAVRGGQKLALPSRRTGLRVAKQLSDARTYVRTEADLEKDIAKNMERERVKREQREFAAVPSHSHTADVKRQDLVSQINKRNRGTNSAVEAAYTPESAAESAMNPFARLPTLTTQIGTVRAPAPGGPEFGSMDGPNGSQPAATSAAQSSSSSSASTAAYNTPASYGSYGSSANGRGGAATRPIAAPVSGAQPAGRTISLNQYFNRR